MNWIATSGDKNMPEQHRTVLAWVECQERPIFAAWNGDVWLQYREEVFFGASDISHYCEITPPGEANDVQALIAYVKEQAFDGVDYECGVTYQTETMEELIKKAEAL